MKDAHAPAADPQPVSLFATVHAWVSRAWARCCGAPPAVESGTAATAPETTTKEEVMAKKVVKKRLDKRTSRRLASLASKVLSNKGECTKHEAKRLAACVLSQTQD